MNFIRSIPIAFLFLVLARPAAASQLSGAPYPWCAKYSSAWDTAPLELASIRRDLPADSTLWSVFDNKTATKLARSLCVTASPDAKAAVDAIWSAWKAPGLPESQLNEYLTLVVGEQATAQADGAACDAFESKRGAERAELAADALWRRALSCGNNEVRSSEVHDWPELSPIEITAQWGTCVAALEGAADPSGKATKQAYRAVSLIEYAVCKKLASMSDVTAYRKQVDGEKRLDAYGRVRTKLFGAELAANWKRISKGFEAVLSEDKAYRAVVDEVAPKAFSSFVTAYTANTPLYERARQNLLSTEAPSCSGIEEYVHAKISSSKARTIDALQDVMIQPDVYLLLGALAQCYDAKGPQGEVSAYMLNSNVADLMGPTGPFVAMRMAAAQFINEHPKKEKLFEQLNVLASGVGPRLTYESKTERDRLSTPDSSTGVVASIVPTANGKKVVFIKERFQYPTFNCVETNRIDKIDRDGKIIYRSNCTFAGMKWATSQVEPAEVAGGFGSLVKPGAFVSIAHSQGKAGIPVTVHESNKENARLLSYLGVPLK